MPGCARFLELRGQNREYNGEYAAAIKDYEQAIVIDSSRVRAHYNLALLRAACPNPEFRDASDARRHAQIIQSAPDLDRDLKRAALAAAAAEAGDFDDAIQHQTEAVEFAPSYRHYLLAERLKLYKNNQPYHRQPGWWRY